MRKWRFVFAFTLLCVVWWIEPSWFGDNRSYIKWQLWASYSALLIESIIGIGMFGWQRRDSLVLRRIEVLERAAGQRDEVIEALLTKVLSLVDHKNGDTDEAR